MGINYSRAVNSGKRLTSIGSEIKKISLKAEKLIDFVPSGYDGQDAKIFAAAINELQSELNSVETEIKSLASKIISVSDQIVKEEDAKELVLLNAAKAK